MINLHTKILLVIKPMRTQFFTHRLICTPEYIYTPDYIYTRVFFAHANWTLGKILSLSVTHQRAVLKSKIYQTNFFNSPISQPAPSTINLHRKIDWNVLVRTNQISNTCRYIMQITCIFDNSSKSLLAILCYFLI